MTSYVNVEILGRLRRDICRLEALLAILEEIEDDKTREKLERFDKHIRVHRKPLLKDLERVEKEMIK